MPGCRRGRSVVGMIWKPKGKAKGPVIWNPGAGAGGHRNPKTVTRVSDLGLATEAIVAAGTTGDEAVEAALALLGLTRADLSDLNPRQHKRLLAELHEGSVAEDMRSDDRARRGLEWATANAASRLLGDLYGLADRRGLPVGQDPKSLDARAIAELALSMVDLRVDRDEAAARILTHVGVEPGREDRLSPEAQKACLRRLDGAGRTLDSESRNTTRPEADRRRATYARRSVAHAWLRVHHRGDPPPADPGEIS